MEKQNISNTDFLNEVTKKLAPIARKQEIDSKYSKAKEDKENELLALENKLKMKVYQEKQNKFNLEKKTIDKMQRLSLYLSQLNPDTISKIDSTFSSKKDSQIQTEEDETGILIEKVSILEKENQNNIQRCRKGRCSSIKKKHLCKGFLFSLHRNIFLLSVEITFKCFFTFNLKLV